MNSSLLQRRLFFTTSSTTSTARTLSLTPLKAIYPIFSRPKVAAYKFEDTTYMMEPFSSSKRDLLTPSFVRTISQLTNCKIAPAIVLSLYTSCEMGTDKYLQIPCMTGFFRCESCGRGSVPATTFLWSPLTFYRTFYRRKYCKGPFGTQLRKVCHIKSD